MKYSKSLCLILVSVLLLGCASKQPYDTEVEKKVIRGENGTEIPISAYNKLEVGNSHATDTSLRLVTRSDTAAAVGVSVVAFVAQAFAGSASGGTFAKEDLRGTKIVVLSNPSIGYFMPNIEAEVKKGLADKPKHLYMEKIEVRPSVWLLMYENLSGSETDYELRYVTSFSKKKEAWQKSGMYFTCEPKPIKAPLEQWQVNNYEKVTKVTQQYMAECMKSFAEQVDSIVS
ncbi:hypothetical protein [Yersinia alsatica]|uniref:hypothetical protein n=1 Tax=Yersinia alsatica TaxID=2890317 RepID=UPI0011A962EB|nr:hypothetical protein [Yersinia alsatica]